MHTLLGQCSVTSEASHFSRALGDLTVKAKDMSEVRNGRAVAANLTTQRL